MAPKADAPETAELIELFKKIGLTQSKAAEAAKSPKSASTLKGIIESHDLVNKSLDEKQAVLLAALAVQGSKLGDAERSYAVGAILDGRLKTTERLRLLQLPDQPNVLQMGTMIAARRMQEMKPVTFHILHQLKISLKPDLIPSILIQQLYHYHRHLSSTHLIILSRPQTIP